MSEVRMHPLPGKLRERVGEQLYLSWRAAMNPTSTVTWVELEPSDREWHRESADALLAAGVVPVAVVQRYWLAWQSARRRAQLATRAMLFVARHAQRQQLVEEALGAPAPRRCEGGRVNEPLVTIDRGHLETLLWFAKRGDVACSRRRLRNWFRKAPVCSARREPGCLACQAFTAAERSIVEDE